MCLMFAGTTICASGEGDNRIPDGVYLEPKKIESVTATGDELTFKIYVSRGQEKAILERKYKYSVSGDGKIRVVGSSNDTGLVFGVLRYDWLWDGKTIVRKDPKSGDTVIFPLQTAAGK